METIDYCFDKQLTEFITDFSDGSLEGIELEVFEEYMQTSNPVRSLALKAKRGKACLQSHKKVKAADDFEEKLAMRIAREKSSENSRYLYSGHLDSVI